MEIEILDRAGMVIPQLLDHQGVLQFLPAAHYDAIDPKVLRVFCHDHARYGLPTVELVQWLQEYIAGRTVIEIGAGAGDLAYHLQIQATDNRMQEWSQINALYKASGQPPIQYPDWVESLDALDAIKKYRPQVVVASWVTEWIDPTKPMPPTGGNAFGVKENLILESGVTYILIGNQKVHGNKQIMQSEHETFYLPFLRSRAKYPELNCVYVWKGK